MAENGVKPILRAIGQRAFWGARRTVVGHSGLLFVMKPLENL